MPTLAAPGSRFPLQSLMVGSCKRLLQQLNGSRKSGRFVWGSVHDAIMAHLTLSPPTSMWVTVLGNLAYQSGATYTNGNIVTSSGLAYIANNGASHPLPNVEARHTPASSPTYWTPYIPPTFFKIAGQASTDNRLELGLLTPR